MQRHIVLGRHPHGHVEPESWTAGRAMPGTTEALSLSKYRLVSRWRRLMWFWVAVLAAAGVGGVALELLGPLDDGIVDEQVAPEPSQLVSLPQDTGVAADPARGPVASSPVRATPDQPPPQAPGASSVGSVAQQDVPPRARAMLVLHPARLEGSAPIANRLAAQTGLPPDQVDVGTVAEARADAVVRFYSAGDHALARRLGKELARMGYTWRIENFAARSWEWKDQAVEVFLPDR